MGQKLFLIDGHSHLYRAFYALRGLTTPDGRPSNAAYGFTAMLRKLLRERRPDYLAVALDLPGKTFRHKLFDQYKATRKKPPDEFIGQLPMAREVLEAMRIPVYSAEGWEADDVLGAIARQGVEKGLDVVIVTGDKDAAQLLGPHVSVLDTQKEETLTPESLRARDGIGPEQVVEVMSLVGDTSDNVPGVPKIGPKTGMALIQQFGTLENLLARLDEVKPAGLQARIRENIALARLSRDLVVIDTNAPVTLDLEECRVRPPDPALLAPVFQRLGFRTFLAEVLPEPTREQNAAYHLVNTPEALQEFLEQIRGQKRISLDVETTSADPMVARLCGISFSWQEAEAWYLVLMAPEGEPRLDAQSTLAALRPFLEDETVAKVGQNIKYDMVVLRNHGAEVRGVAFDTMIAAYLLNPERRRYGLDDLAQDFLNYRMTPISDLIGKGKKQITMDFVPCRKVCDYSCADADIALRLTHRFEKELREQGMYDLFERVEMPLVEVLCGMERQGVRIDVEALRVMSGWLAEKMAGLETRIHELAGDAFNIASPRQLAEVLFTRLKLPHGRHTKTGASTDSDVLERLAPLHPLPALILEYRQLAKLKGTYVDALPALVHPETGNVHTSFNQTATATGRLSSSDPNLQNIPVRTELGEKIRQAFIPSRAEDLLLTADYSQIELRILAHISGDDALRQAFAQDQDIHRFVAAQVNGIAPEDVTGDMRRAAKAVNFGIIYGLTAYGLSRDLGITPMEADRFIHNYFERYPGVRAFIDRTIAQARREGGVVTLAGRRRPLPGLKDADANMRNFSERAAVNTVIQGTAADMIKLAMIRIHERLRREQRRARMLMQIHDELVFELPPDEERAVTDLVVQEMTGALPMDVPVKVNVAVGKNWKEAK